MFSEVELVILGLGRFGNCVAIRKEIIMRSRVRVLIGPCRYAMAHCPQRGLRSVETICLSQDMLQVDLYSRLRNIELCRNHFVRVTAGQRPQDLQLSVREIGIVGFRIGGTLGSQIRND